jgi:hypothetical protein
MANYIPYARSNYFHVKDAAAFEEWLNTVNVEFYKDSEGRYGLFPEESFPEWIYDDETGDEFEVNWIESLSSHLQKDQVAIIMEVGHEKLRYLVGYALAIHSSGEWEQISIDDIYGMVEERWGISPTTTTY